MLDALRDGEPFFNIGEDYPYIKKVKTLKQIGIIKGDGKGYFKPKDFITKEETALIAYRVVKMIENYLPMFFHSYFMKPYKRGSFPGLLE